MPDPRTIAERENPGFIEPEMPDPSPDPTGNEPKPVNVQSPQPTDRPFKDLRR